MLKRLLQSERDKKELESLAHDPATQQDDFFDYTNVVIKKPWGHEYLIYQNKDAAIWMLHMRQGFRTSTHCHPNKKTSLTVLGGEVMTRTLDAEFNIYAGQGIIIEKGVFHSTEALNPEWSVVMEVETPTNKQDLVRLHDAYGRRGKRYEGQEHHSSFDSSLRHFHADAERYHCPKRFEDCELTIIKSTDDAHCLRRVASSPGDIVVLLQGSLHNSENKCIMETGDSLWWRDFCREKDLVSHGDIECLLIKKINT